MKKYLLFLILSAFFTSELHAGTQLTPQGRLRKLSRQIRGVDPDYSEYQKLSEALSNNKTESFFIEETKAFLNSPENTGKMSLRLEELFRIKTSPGPSEKIKKIDETGYDSDGYLITHNSINALFNDLTLKNRSWDTLATGTDYTVYFPIVNYGIDGDARFFRGIFSDLEKETAGDKLYYQAPHRGKEPIEVHGDPRDPRLAGAVTTSTFLSRYTTTDINENRRRAAAVFRIFLCESLQPVFLENLDELKPFLRQALGQNSQAQIHPPIMAEQRHGTDKSCIGCHERLDPLGQTFGYSGTSLMTVPVPGRLFFRRKDGSTVNIQGRGLGDLMRGMIKLPEYKECQVKHFWSWFIGDDVPVDGKLNELVSHFDAVGHRTNDFIEYLVNRPEFYQRPQNTAVTFTQVQPTLNRCTTCHAGTNVAPDFSRLPIQGSMQGNQTWISKIYKAMDLSHDGLHRKMPVKDSDWQPTQDEINQLKAWITDGAKNEQGEKTLTDSYLVKLKEGK